MLPYSENAMYAAIQKYNADNSHKVEPTSQDVTDLWHIYLYHMYDQFYANMFTQLVPILTDSFTGNVGLVIGITYALLVIDIIVLIIQFFGYAESEKRIKFTLSLLLHFSKILT